MEKWRTMPWYHVVSGCDREEKGRKRGRKERRSEWSLFLKQIVLYITYCKEKILNMYASGQLLNFIIRINKKFSFYDPNMN